MSKNTSAFEGSESAAAFIERVQAFVRDELAPLAAEPGVDSERGADRALLQRVWKLSHQRGFYGMTLPKAMGGADFSVVDQVLVKEAIYSTGSPFAPQVLGELSGPPRLGALVKTANAEQMERFILPVARAEKALCFAITEPEAGSDAASLQTRADPDGDGFVLNGVNRFISGSPFCDMAVIIAATDLDQRETTAFFVERDRPGFRIQAGYKTMAGQSGTGNIVLENCRIPAINQIGERGQGLALALGRITVNRLLYTPAMLGLARLAYEDARAHALERKQFGQPDRRVPGGAAHARRHGDRTRRGTRADAQRRTPARPRRRRARGELDGQAVLLGDGVSRRRPRGADPRQRGHRAGQPRGVPVSRAAHVARAHRHHRDPAQHDRARDPAAGLTRPGSVTVGARIDEHREFP